MAIEIALPFGEQIRDQRLKLARHQPVFEVRRPQAFPRSPGFEVVVGSLGLPPLFWELRIDRFR